MQGLSGDGFLTPLYYGITYPFSDQSRVIAKVVQNVNWNAKAADGSHPCRFMIAANPNNRCYRFSDVETVISVYRNLVEKNPNFPEYDRVKNPGKIEFIEQQVAKGSNQSVKRTAAILWELYWATRYNQVDDPRWIAPRSWKANEKLRENESKSTLSTIENILKYGIGLAVVIGGVALVSYGAKQYSTIKGAFKK